MLIIDNIETGYEKKQVLFGVSFVVNDCEIVLLNGGNGSGKSTVLKCIYGLLNVWNEGRINFNGDDITGEQPSSMISKGIVYIPQKNNYFENLNVRSNLEISGTTIKDKKLLSQRIEEVYSLTGLAKYSSRTPFSMSGGERQLLALGMALIHKPKLILFDEPFGGLDKENSDSMLKTILTLNKDGITFLIVEHKLLLSKYTNRVYKIELGRNKD